MDNEVGLVGKLKNKIKARNEKDWEEVYTKSTLKWFRLEVERYVRSGKCEVAVQVEDGSSGLLEKKKKCRMVSYEGL